MEGCLTCLCVFLQASLFSPTVVDPAKGELIPELEREGSRLGPTTEDDWRLLGALLRSDADPKSARGPLCWGESWAEREDAPVSKVPYHETRWRIPEQREQ